MIVSWKTKPKPFDNLIQVRDDYVVHARGYTIGGDLWLDEYSLHLEHHRWWNDAIRHHYDFEKWETGDSWTYYSAIYIDRPNIYWSINGNDLFILQYPRREQLGEDEFSLLIKTLEKLKAPDDTRIRVETSNDMSAESNNHTASVLNPSMGKSQARLGDIDGIETLK